MSAYNAYYFKRTEDFQPLLTALVNYKKIITWESVFHQIPEKSSVIKKGLELKREKYIRGKIDGDKVVFVRDEVKSEYPLGQDTSVIQPLPALIRYSLKKPGEEDVKITALAGRFSLEDDNEDRPLVVQVPDSLADRSNIQKILGKNSQKIGPIGKDRFGDCLSLVSSILNERKKKSPENSQEDSRFYSHPIPHFKKNTKYVDSQGISLVRGYSEITPFAQIAVASFLLSLTKPEGSSEEDMMEICYRRGLKIPGRSLKSLVRIGALKEVSTNVYGFNAFPSGFNEHIFNRTIQSFVGIRSDIKDAFLSTVQDSLRKPLDTTHLKQKPEIVFSDPIPFYQKGVIAQETAKNNGDNPYRSKIMAAIYYLYQSNHVCDRKNILTVMEGSQKATPQILNAFIGLRNSGFINSKNRAKTGSSLPVDKEPDNLDEEYPALILTCHGIGKNVRAHFADNMGLTFDEFAGTVPASKDTPRIH